MAETLSIKILIFGQKLKWHPPVSETLLHETTHLVSMTDDIVVYDAVQRGF